jgi:hypothetical protein
MDTLEIGMRKFVVLLVVLLALFTFLRDFPSATPNSSAAITANIRPALVP